MHPHDLRTLADGGERCANRSRNTFTSRLHPCYRTDNPLARCANQQRQPKSVKQTKPTQQRQVMLKRLAKPDTRVDDNFVPRNACLLYTSDAADDRYKV